MYRRESATRRLDKVPLLTPANLVTVHLETIMTWCEGGLIASDATFWPLWPHLARMQIWKLQHHRQDGVSARVELHCYLDVSKHQS